MAVFAIQPTVTIAHPIEPIDRFDKY